MLKGSPLAKLRGPAQGRALLDINAKGWVEPAWRELCLPPAPAETEEFRMAAYEASVAHLWE